MAPEGNSVGKRIVEALKMQNGENIDNFSSVSSSDSLNDSFDEEFNFDDKPETSSSEDNLQDADFNYSDNNQNYAPVSNMSIDTAFAQSISQNLGYNVNDIPDDFEYPANVAILRQLVSKLPQGVSKQMGATIIKQTLEAVGIPMSGVLDEARQVQNELNEKARSCQSSIIDCRKQISALEIKSKQYQKQFALMNEMINLFLHVN